MAKSLKIELLSCSLQVYQSVSTYLPSLLKKPAPTPFLVHDTWVKIFFLYKKEIIPNRIYLRMGSLSYMQR